MCIYILSVEECDGAPFRPSSPETGAGRSLNSRPAWSIPGLPGIHSKTLYQKKKTRKRNLLSYIPIPSKNT